MSRMNRSFAVRSATSVLILTVMAALAQIFSDREIIFPEIAAIATGALLVPGIAWKTSKKRIFATIMICAVLGVLIVLYCPGPVWFQMSVAFLIGQLVLSVSGTSFAPCVSAIVLPVMLQAATAVYLLSAFCFTTGILLVRVMFERLRILPEKKDTDFEPSDLPPARFVFSKTALGILWIVIAMMSGMTFAAAPPVLVAYTESCNSKSGLHSSWQMLFKGSILIMLCAMTGSYLRLGVCVNAHLPLAVATAIGMILVILMMSGFHMFLPPAAALCMLAMLIPEDRLMLYPVQVGCGALVLFLLGRLSSDEIK